MTSSSHVNRRALLKRSAAAGVLAVPAMGALSACASGGSDGDGGGAAEVEATDDNPLGVDAEARLEVVIFDGGFGDQYALDAGEIYMADYGEIDHSKTQEIRSRLQPRMVSGDPPDLINNSGAEQMDMPALISNDQVADLTPLLDAPSLDDPDVPVRDTLVPGTVEVGQYGGQEVYQLNYAYTIYGTWYSRTALERLGVEYPRTWDEMLSVCEKAKKEDIAGWTYAGQHPYYFTFTLLPFIAKIGGADVLKAIDNLEPNAWRHDAVKAAFEAYYELQAKGYILRGTPGLDHIESQTEWTKGRALFLPNGSWVENEAAETTPDDFEMAVAPPTSLDSGDAMPFETVYAAAGEPFIVPADAGNRAGGMEFLRIMLGRESARNFTQLVSSLSCVQGAAEGLDLPPGLSTASQVLEAAGENVVNPRFREWYPELFRERVGGEIAAMMSGDIDPDRAIANIQRHADDTAADDSIQKFQHP